VTNYPNSSIEAFLLTSYAQPDSQPDWYTYAENLTPVNISTQKLEEYLSAGTPSSAGPINLGKPGNWPTEKQDGGSIVMQGLGPKGIKFDSEKLRPSLLPMESLEVVTKVLMFGSAKYSDHNWKIVPNARARYIDAALRHLMASVRGEENDNESGMSHIAHCICCLLFVLWFDIKGGK
jgi:hypothetical protein